MTKTTARPAGPSADGTTNRRAARRAAIEEQLRQRIAGDQRATRPPSSGGDIVLRCEPCGETSSADARFCTHCGTKFNATIVRPACLWLVLALLTMPVAARSAAAQPGPVKSGSVPVAPAPSRVAQPPVLSTQADPPAGARPEPAAMSGYPLQVGDLPPGIVAVRVIRESFQANVAGVTVLLRVGDSDPVRSATTNTDGRAQFEGLRVGQRVRVRAVLEGEALESQPFEIPAQGGVRMVLVAGVGAPAATEPWPSPVPAVRAALPPASTAPVQAGSTVTASNVVAGAALIALGVVGFVGVRVGRVRSRDSRRATRARLFETLVSLEQRHRSGHVDEREYGARREALLEDLVDLDEDLEDNAPAAAVLR